MRTHWKIPSLAALAFMTACGGAYETGHGYGYRGGYGGYEDYYGGIYSHLAPPQPLVEVLPPQPGPTHAWIAGYWAWDGGRYVWQRGYWDRAPAGHVWLRHGWVPYAGRYRYVPGRWVPGGRVPSVPYVHRAPSYRYGPRYGVIPGTAQRHPYAYVPPQYHQRRQGTVWAEPGARRGDVRRPPSVAYPIP